MRLYTYVKYTPGSLLLQQEPTGFLQNNDKLKFIPFELDLSSTPFGYEKIITYEIELPTAGKKIGSNLMDDDEFTIPYIIGTITNYLTFHLLLKQTKKIFRITTINRENPITSIGSLEKLHYYNTQFGNSKVNIIL